MSDPSTHGIMVTLRCVSPDCREVLGQAHAMSLAIFRVFKCHKCQVGSDFNNPPSGWNGSVLPPMRKTR